jgi:uncharacterized protein
MITDSSRLHVVDALRGFAIVSIMLLHNIEHFDFYFIPEGLPAWMVTLDKGIWDTLFFLFGGKSYAIFALLFGLTFFIQSDNQARRGFDFRGRFAWRLLLLLLFGIINSSFYQGDILTIYALIGLVLIPVARLGDRSIFWIALFLMLQPYEWFALIKGLQNPGASLADPVSWSYYARTGEYIAGDSLLKTWVGNLTTGKTAVIYWNWENGRVFQTASLFMFGMLAGRKKLFVMSDSSRNFWKRTLLVASVAFIPLFIIKTNIAGWIGYEALSRPASTIVNSWSNMAFMLVLVSGFVLLYRDARFNRALNIFSSYGRMSLSNYIMQSVLGSFIYYGYGLGLYKYTGATLSLIIGILLALLQGCFSAWWLKYHKKGPFETVWHYATWIGSK